MRTGEMSSAFRVDIQQMCKMCIITSVIANIRRVSPPVGEARGNHPEG